MQLGTETLHVEASRSEEDSGGWGFIKSSAGSVGGRRDGTTTGETGPGRFAGTCVAQWSRRHRHRAHATASVYGKQKPANTDCVVSVVRAQQRRLKLKSGGPVVMTCLSKCYEWMKIYVWCMSKNFRTKPSVLTVRYTQCIHARSHKLKLPKKTFVPINQV